MKIFYPVVSGGSRGGPPLFCAKKEEKSQKEETPVGQAKQNRPSPPPLAQGLDLVLVTCQRTSKQGYGYGPFTLFSLGLCEFFLACQWREIEVSTRITFLKVQSNPAVQKHRKHSFFYDDSSNIDC